MLNYLDGYDRKEVTLRAMHNVAKGQTVSMISDYTVMNSQNGQVFVGICTKADDYTASVLLRGFVIVPYSGEAPDYGYNNLAGDGNGGVKLATVGRETLVVSIDEEASVCGIIL